MWGYALNFQSQILSVAETKSFWCVRGEGRYRRVDEAGVMFIHERVRFRQLSVD
jgi:hypothetical protein